MNDGIYPSPQYQKSDEYLQSGPQHTGILVTDFALDDFANGMRLCLELRPPLGLFFIPQVIYEHGESWWMMSIGENTRSVHQSAFW
jgi:hypothetical protein